MKNYYEILGVEKGAKEDEIRKRYRKLAMEYHPDRNPGSPDAEDKFKEISEAYGVLADPVKRRQYDAHLAAGGKHKQYDSTFSYSQEDILRDLFRDPRFQQMFQGILREFQRSGLRSSPHFIRKSFFGGKGGFLLGGIFFFGSLAGPALLKGGRKKLPGGGTVLKSIGRSVGSLLNMRKKDSSQKQEDLSREQEDLDVTYQTPLDSDQLKRGISTEVVTHGPAGREVLKVRIPPGSRYGQKLRLRGKGRQGRNGRGDLYLELCRRG